jgi:hypothetical protein
MSGDERGIAAVAQYFTGSGAPGFTQNEWFLKRLIFHLQLVDHYFGEQDLVRLRKTARRTLKMLRGFYRNVGLIDAAWWDFSNGKYLPKTPKHIVKAWEKRNRS